MVGKKTPMRKCIVTGQMQPKKELIRIVRSKEGEISVDENGKKPGRGAYITKDVNCILQAKQKKILENLLKTKIDETIYEILLKLTDKE